jgi:hypothetical protein
LKAGRKKEISCCQVIKKERGKALLPSLVAVLNVGVLTGGYSFTVVVIVGTAFSHSVLLSFFTAGATSSPLSPLYKRPFFITNLMLLVLRIFSTSFDMLFNPSLFKG